MIARLKILVVVTLLSFGYHASSEDYYWIGGSGNWSDIAHWATQSGGSVLHIRVPEADDNVIFDHNSFSTPGNEVLINLGNAVCRDFDWSGALFNPKVVSQDSINLRVYGSFRLTQNMIFEYKGTVWFEAVDEGFFIDMAGHSFNNTITFQGIGGGWELESDLSCYTDIFFLHGFIKINGNSLSSTRFVSDMPNSRKLDISNSSIYISEWIVNGANLTLSTSSSVIYSSYSVYNFSGSRLKYNDIHFTGGRCQLLQGETHCQFNNVIFNCNSGAYEVSTVEGNCTIDTLRFNLNGKMCGSINGADSINKLFTNNPTGIHGTNVFNAAYFLNDGFFGGANQFDSLFLNPGYSYEFAINSTQKVVRELLIQGTCEAPIRLYSSYKGTAASIQKLNGPVTGEYLSLRDIHAIGSNLPFRAYHSVDLGNNSNWNIETSGNLNLFWVKGGGNWDDPAHWDVVSGGPGGHCPPTEIDNAIFDDNSFNSSSSNEVLIRLKNAVCHDMTWTDVTNNPSLNGSDTCNLRIFGSLQLDRNMTVPFWGNIVFESEQKNETIKTNGNIISRNVLFTGTNGGWSLLDSLTVRDTIYFRRGELYTRGQAVSCVMFSSEDTLSRKLVLSTSTVTIGYYWRLNGNNIILKADSSLIRTINDGAYVYTYNGNRHKYHNIEMHGTQSYIQNDAYCIFNYVTCLKRDSYVARDCTIDSLAFFGINSHVYDRDTINYVIFYDRNGFVEGQHIINECIFKKDGFINGINTFNVLRLSPASTYYLEHDRQQTIIDELDAFGTCTAPINIQSGHPTVRASIYKSTGNVHGIYLVVKNINASGPGIPFIAENSIDLGNNTNWVFTEPDGLDLYWIGGSGNWDDSLHWALNSGGTGGNCIPTSKDNVFFDKKSFTGGNQVVTINITDAMCNNMDWTGCLFLPQFYGADTFNIRIFGSLKLVTGMNWNFYGRTYFEARQMDREITSAGNFFKNPVIFQGRGGGWSLLDNLSCVNVITLKFGSLNTNGKNIFCDVFESNYTSARKLNISSSVIQLGEWHITADSLDFISYPGSLIVAYRSVNTNNGNPVIYNNIEFHGSCSLNNNNTRSFFNNVTYLGNPYEAGQVNGNCHIDSIYFETRGLINNSDTIRYALFNRFADINGSHLIHQCYLNESGRISGTNQFDTLKLTPGSTYELQETQVQVINEYFKVRGNNCFPIVLRSQKQGIQATISAHPGVEVTGDFLDLRDMIATGGANFYAGLHSTDISNNNGWIFNNSPGYIYGFGIDTTLCSNQSYLITTDNFNPESNTTFEWHDGSTLPYFLSTTEDTVSIKVYYAPGCVYPDTLFIERLPIPELELANEMTSCDVDTIFLPPQEIPVTYLWQDGSTDTMFVVNEEGWYWVRLTSNEGCIVTDSIYVRVFPSPVIDLGDDITVKWGETIILDAGNPGANYLWSSGETTQIIVADGPQTYWVDVEKDGCNSSDTIKIDEYPRCVCEVPNAFSPNGDTQNDILYVYGDGFRSFELLIFNRFGEMVYRSEDQGEGWNGTFNGQPQPLEVYNYILRGICTDGSNFMKKGNITLLR